MKNHYQRVVKSVSLPYDESIVFETARQRILEATGKLIVYDSEVLRIGLQAILELDRKKLAKCAEKCPEQRMGRPTEKKQEQMSSEEIERFFADEI